mmetsp:Transcript_5046/g.7403  ORF Transcript_5046/g.7403 Transcript_5046/m.7403 type:complete len:87 (-) Transcript_5046:68-328(-)
MAFEDSVLLCRKFGSEKASSSGLNHDDFSMTCKNVSTTLREFEKERLERVKIIWEDEWVATESNLGRGKEHKIWTDEYREWLFAGI